MPKLKKVRSTKAVIDSMVLKRRQESLPGQLSKSKTGLSKTSPRPRTAKGRRTTASKPVTLGKRVGTKKSDKRWQSLDGQIWASRFEYEVFTALVERGYNVRKCTTQDSLPYTSIVRQGICRKCRSEDVVTLRTYTPDLYVLPPSGGQSDQDRAGYYIEAKGYLRSERRSLLRSFRKENQGLDLRFIVQRDYNVTDKRTISKWVTDLMKCKVHVWNGDIPKGWQ